MVECMGKFAFETGTSLGIGRANALFYANEYIFRTHTK